MRGGLTVGNTELRDALDALRADFPGWHFSTRWGRLCPWQAHHAPLSPYGGVAALTADTPVRLRELLAAASEINDRAVLRAMAEALAARGIVTALYGSLLTVTRPGREHVIECTHDGAYLLNGARVGDVHGVRATADRIAAQIEGPRP
jgi:hypothetical protein